MKNKLTALAVAAVLTLSIPLVAAAKAPAMAELLPADSLGYVEIPDMGVFYYVISELGGSAVQSLEEESELPEAMKVKARAILEAFNEIKPVLPRSASLGIVSVDPQREMPSALLVGELSEAITPFLSALSKLAAVVPEIKLNKTEHGLEFSVPRKPDVTIGCAVRDNVLYLALGEGLLEQALSGDPSGKLAQTAQFKEISAITATNAIASAYVNVDAIREKILARLPEEAKQRKILELLGLKDIHAAGLSLAADESKVGFNLALQFTESAEGVASLLSIPNTAPKGLAYIPQDFSYVTRFSLGPPDEFLKKVQRLVQKLGADVNFDDVFAGIKEKANVDLNKVLASLGGEVTIGVKIPETLAIPNIVLCLEARDPAYLVETLKTLFGREQSPITISEVDVDGRKVLQLTPKIAIPITPAIVADGDMIVVGLSTTALQQALAAKASGQGIASKPSFRAAMEGLPTASNISLEYIETQELGRLIVVGLGLASSRAPAEAQPMIARAMEFAKKAVENLEPAAEVAYRTPGGIAVQSRWGTRSLMQVLNNGAAVIAKAAMMFLHRIEAPREEPAKEAAAVPTPAEVAEALGPANEQGKSLIDLDPFVTKPLINPHGSSEGNDIPFQPGKYHIGDGDYRIANGIVQLSGTNLQDAPEEVKGIKIGLKAKKLEILHATGWGSGVADGTQIGTYVIRYEDGSTAELPIKYGVHVRDWWAFGASEVSEGKVAWTGRNQQSNLRLYSLTWENPSPDKVVKEIDCRTSGTACAPFVVAITAEI